MATIMSAYLDGKRIGHCDQRCYDAKGEKCRCVCGGLNHGAGEHLARIHAKMIKDDVGLATAAFEKLIHGAQLHRH